jgi:outer membrane protein assembly factor BamB
MKKYKFLFFFVVVFFVWASNAAGNIAVSPWPMLQHDIFHTGLSVYRGPDISVSGVIFTENINAGVSSPVIAADGTIYAGSTDGCLYAVLPDGTDECLYDTGAAIESTPVILDDGTIFVGSSNGNLYAITREGNDLWSPKKLGETVMSASR